MTIEGSGKENLFAIIFSFVSRQFQNFKLQSIYETSQIVYEHSQYCYLWMPMFFRNIRRGAKKERRWEWQWEIKDLRLLDEEETVLSENLSSLESSCPLQNLTLFVCCPWPTDTISTPIFLTKLFFVVLFLCGLHCFFLCWWSSQSFVQSHCQETCKFPITWR